MIFNILDRTRQTIVYRTGLLVYTEREKKKFIFFLVVVVAPPLVGGVVECCRPSTAAKLDTIYLPSFCMFQKNVHTGYSFGM
jgi:hypothetical protein